MTCNECLFKVICNVYADAGVTDVPKSDVTPCELFTNKGDFVSVVRCRECKYYVASYCTRDIKGRTHNTFMQPYDFCSYGEERETE